MKRSTVPTDVVVGRHRAQAEQRPRRVDRRRGVPFRALGVAAALLLTASGSTLGVGGPAAPRLDAVTQVDTAPPEEAAAGQEIGADGDSPPTAQPPAQNSGRIRPVAPAGENRSVRLAGGSDNGIPISVLTSYRHAAAVLGRAQPGCHLPMTLLAAIGRVESGHAAGGWVDRRGTTRRAILGPVLDGSGGTAAIRDTDDGRYDGNTTWDRAVGPMQFIPSTWRLWATDGNADGLANPHNVFDATMAAGRYLCADGRDLDTADGLREAVFSYNHSDSYVRLVLAWMDTYAGGTAAVPDGTGPASGRGSTDNPQAMPAPDDPDDRRDGPVAPRPGGSDGGGSSGAPGTSSPSRPPATTEPPTASPDPSQPAPAEGDPLTSVVCTVQAVVGVGTGLVGGLLPLLPPPPECAPPTTTAPATMAPTTTPPATPAS